MRLRDARAVWRGTGVLPFAHPTLATTLSFPSLQKKASVYMVGWHTLGIIAIMDGAECVPTFGTGEEAGRRVQLA